MCARARPSARRRGGALCLVESLPSQACAVCEITGLVTRHYQYESGAVGGARHGVPCVRLLGAGEARRCGGVVFALALFAPPGAPRRARVGAAGVAAYLRGSVGQRRERLWRCYVHVYPPHPFPSVFGLLALAPRPLGDPRAPCAAEAKVERRARFCGATVTSALCFTQHLRPAQFPPPCGGGRGCKEALMTHCAFDSVTW
ncbi:MAG: hypothetical protein J3K34DRAFT_401327 [Monoraphidium minutum]|nr:MAG: hypothetical protein J3K34DRAFT_401327 [Monoraphidium minutum]